MCQEMTKTSDITHTQVRGAKKFELNTDKVRWRVTEKQKIRALIGEIDIPFRSG